MSELIKSLLQKAIELSMTQCFTGPFGAIVVNANNEIIGAGQNSVTHTNDPTAHAEIVAIRQACQNIRDFNLTGCSLYTSCEPCPMCLSACYWAHIKQIYYACTADNAAQVNFDDAFIYEELAIDISKRQLPMIQVVSLREEALKAFDKWSKNPNKIEY